MSSVYLDLLSLTAGLVCASSVVVMTVWTLPDAWASWRNTTDAEKTYSWWVLFRAALCYACLVLFAVTGFTVAALENDSGLRQQITRHALFLGIVGVAVVGLSGPVERRSIQRALREEEGAASDGRLRHLEEKQDDDLEVSRETKRMVGEIREEQRAVRDELEDLKGGDDGAPA